jgi:ribonuclease T2
MAFEIPSIRSLLSFAGGLVSQIPFMSSPHTPSNALSNAPSCPADSPLSCHNKTVAPDSCCFIYPGGQLLQTQFWDTDPAIGPADSWTLHGLCMPLFPYFYDGMLMTIGPDLCDGTYPTYCTSAPQYTNITDIITAAGQTDLLDFMNSYWLPNEGTSESFWEHEWNKHGTCINTLAPSCYGYDYHVGEEVVDFFNRAVEVFKVIASRFPRIVKR